MTTRKLRYGVVAIVLTLFVSCSEKQIQILKNDLLPNVLGSVTQAFGAPYSNLVNSFFEIATSSSKDDQGMEQVAYYSEEDYYQQGTYVQEEEVYYQEDYYQEQETYRPEQESRLSREEDIVSAEELIKIYSPARAQQKTEAIRQELEVAIDVIKEVYEHGRYQARPIKDGDTLTKNDSYKVTFQCNMQCYMYIIQLDATGKMDPILPSKYFFSGNPIEPYTFYDIPSAEKWFYLDENIGVETIYFIVSRSRRPDLEKLFHKLEEKNKSLVQRVHVSIDSSVVITRGIGGVRPGQKQVVNFQDGSQGQYSSTLISSIKADLVMTRWFYHR